MDKRYGVAAKMLTGRIKTWFAFPEWFTYKEPVNTLTVPAPTPGGLSTQYSSIGHYALADDEALLVEVPVERGAVPSHPGRLEVVRLDRLRAPPDLADARAVARRPGRHAALRHQPSATPGIANWLETTGHAAGVMMLRWQRRDAAADDADGPRVSVVPVASLASMSSLDDQRDDAVRVRRPHRGPSDRGGTQNDLVSEH